MDKKSKEYYLSLAERWFDAETSEAEERELRLFLAGTDDPDFDEARAALGFLAAEAAQTPDAKRAEEGVAAKPVATLGHVRGRTATQSTVGAGATAEAVWQRQPSAANDPSAAKPTVFRRLVPALAVAAGVAAAFVLGRLSATDVTLEVAPQAGSCYSYVHGVEINDEDFAVTSMENTLYDLFSPVSAPDPRTDLTLIFNANK